MKWFVYSSHYMIQYRPLSSLCFILTICFIRSLHVLCLFVDKLVWAQLKKNVMLNLYRLWFYQHDICRNVNVCCHFKRKTRFKKGCWGKQTQKRSKKAFRWTSPAPIRDPQKIIWSHIWYTYTKNNTYLYNEK